MSLTFMVAIDGSKASYVAVEEAVKLFDRKRKDTIVLAHVHKNDHPSPAEAALDMKIISTAQAKCEESAIQPQILWEEGSNIAVELCTLAKNQAADYLLVGSEDSEESLDQF